MKKQLFIEDVEVGTEIPTLVKHVTTRQIVKWAGTSEDYMEYHYDKDFALNYGFPGVITHGMLVMAFLGQLMVDWIGEDGILKKLGCNWRAPTLPGQDLSCKGKVTKKYVQDGEHYVECELWGENPKGERNVVGTSVAVLPSRG